MTAKGHARDEGDGIAPALTFELARFTVHDGEEAALLAERPAMVQALRRAFPAARAAWLTKQDDGSWLDIVLWSSRVAAEEAAEQVGELPGVQAWFRHIAELQDFRHVEVIHADPS
jgi:hypothetical protein